MVVTFYHHILFFVGTHNTCSIDSKKGKNNIVVYVLFYTIEGYNINKIVAILSTQVAHCTVGDIIELSTTISAILNTVIIDDTFL